MEEQKEDRNLYLLLGEMKGMLTTALSGLETVREDHKEHKEAVAVRLNGHSDRITALERSYWKMAGIAGAAVVVIPVVLTIIQMVFIK